MQKFVQPADSKDLQLPEGCTPEKYPKLNQASLFEVDGAVNQRCKLKFVFVPIFFFCKIFEVVYMFAIANIDGTGSFSTELMKMLIRKVCVEFYFVEMITLIVGVGGFSGYCTESVIVTVTAFIKDFRAAGYFVDMFLFAAVMWFVIHNETPFFFII